MPYMSSSTVRVSPSRRLAEVPVTYEIGLKILMLEVSWAYGLQPPNFSNRFRTQKAVMILVREAT